MFFATHQNSNLAFLLFLICFKVNIYLTFLSNNRHTCVILNRINKLPNTTIVKLLVNPVLGNSSVCTSFTLFSSPFFDFYSVFLPSLSSFLSNKDLSCLSTTFESKNDILS